MRRLIVIAVLFGLWTGVAAAQTGGSFNLTWNTIDGGGLTFSTGGGYELGGAVGQADAQAQMTGSGGYALQGGFWSPPGYLVHTPIVRKP